MYHHLRSWALLLFLVQSQQRDVGYLDDLETDTGNITDGVTLTTETGNQNLVVLLNVVQATVTRYESGNLLAVLDELNPHALADGRVRLLGFNTTAEGKERPISSCCDKRINNCRVLLLVLLLLQQLTV